MSPQPQPPQAPPSPPRRGGFSHVLAASSSYGRNALPRAAALADVQAVADIVSVEDGDTFVRPIYAGNALATVRCAGPGPRYLTARPTAFAAAGGGGAFPPAAVESVAEEDLQAARVREAAVQSSTGGYQT